MIWLFNGGQYYYVALAEAVVSTFRSTFISNLAILGAKFRRDVYVIVGQLLVGDCDFDFSAASRLAQLVLNVH